MPVPVPVPARDRGSTSLTLVLLTPIFTVVAFMAFQAAMWTHARTEARAAARDAAVLVGRFGAEPADVRRSTSESLDDKSVLELREVTIVEASGTVRVTIAATAHGIITGTSSDFEVTEAVPVEEYRP